MSITIRVEGAEELIRKLTTLEQMNRVKSVCASSSARSEMVRTAANGTP